MEEEYSLRVGGTESSCSNNSNYCYYLYKRFLSSLIMRTPAFINNRPKLSRLWYSQVILLFTLIVMNFYI